MKYIAIVKNEHNTKKLETENKDTIISMLLTVYQSYKKPEVATQYAMIALKDIEAGQKVVFSRKGANLTFFKSN